VDERRSATTRTRSGLKRRRRRSRSIARGVSDRADTQTSGRSGEPNALHLPRLVTGGRRAHHRCLVPSNEESARRTRVLRRARAGEILLRQCAWCGRFDVRGEWLDLEEIGEGQHWDTAKLLEHTTSGICPACFEQQAEDVEAARLRSQKMRPSE
jgi:hypothetical protein